MFDKKKWEEPARFVVTGTIATVVQYAVYYALMDLIGVSWAWSVGYVISFICNFVLTTYFTFKVKPDKKKAGGFAVSHMVNWAMQMGTLHFFIFAGVDKTWAPLPMYMVCMPVNFLLVRFFVKTKGNTQ